MRQSELDAHWRLLADIRRRLANLRHELARRPRIKDRPAQQPVKSVRRELR